MEGEIVHYEIPAKNPAKLSKFYASVLGWKFSDSKMPGMKYWVFKAQKASAKAMGIGGMYKKSAARQGPVNYMSVKNIDLALKKIKQNGGKIAMPKMAIPKMGWSAVALDPEGNAVGFFQMDPKAAKK